MAVVMSKKQDGVAEKIIIWGTFVLGPVMQLKSFIISLKCRWFHLKY